MEKQKFSKENLHYNQEIFTSDQWDNLWKRPIKANVQQRREQNLRHYQAKNCNGCPPKGQCYKAKGNRSIERNCNQERHKEQTRIYC